MLSNWQNDILVLRTLRIKSAGLIIASGLMLYLAYRVLLDSWDPAFAQRWLILSSAAVGYLFLTLWSVLHLNRRRGVNELSPALGAGNLVTLGRGLLLAGLAGFLLSPQPTGWISWVPAAFYLLASFADYLDGFLARSSGNVTRLGERLDMSLDGLGVLLACLLAYKYGQTPVWYLAVGLARYLFLLGIRYRERRGFPVYGLPPSVSRRALAGVQMGFLGVILLPLFSPPGTHYAATLFMAPFLAGFLRDWVVVTRGRDFFEPGTFRRIYAASVPYLSAGMRLVSGVILAGSLLMKLPGSLLPGWLAGESAGYPAGVWIGFGIVEAILLVMIVGGIAGRTGALGALLLMGVYQLYAALTAIQIALIVSACGVFFLGTGPYALWAPEDRLIRLPAGES